MQTVEINQANVSVTVKDGFLMLKTKTREERLPLDLVDCLILNSYGAYITNQTLIRLCEENIPLIIAGRNAVPIGMLQANKGHVNRKERLEAQLHASLPLQKRMWQTVVKEKIQSQADLLKAKEKEYKDLLYLATKVQSGDVANVEATAARKYWQRLLGEDFRRDPEREDENTILNYGYTIIRAAFCRAIAAAGLLSELGIHHKNALNPFCLADDLMEPYRPLVDELVFHLQEQQEIALTPAIKRELIGLLDSAITFAGEICHVRFCIEQTVQSFVTSCYKQKNMLVYPG